MAGLTNSDSVRRELVRLLIDGAHDEPMWHGFLETLRNAVNADYATLNLRWPGRTSADAINLVAGAPANLDVALFDSQYFPDRGPPPHSGTVEGVVYPLTELERLDGGLNAEFFRDLRSKFSVNALLQMRVREPSGVGAWLGLVRHERAFEAPEIALLGSLAGELRSVLRLYVVQERYRYSAAIAGDATRRLSFGWLVLDEDCVILDCDSQAAAILEDKRVLMRDKAGKLCAPQGEVRRELTGLIREVANSQSPRTRAIRLSRDPWFDLLVTRARQNFVASPAKPAAVAYIHGDSWSTVDRCEQLAELFELYPREAQLALALSRGMTIAESAKAFGLTENTARIYTKAIYAKTGARGLPDLVRIVMRSVLAFAPDSAVPSD
ncbi:MAG: helix-turn-helix transcriptional regulator [Novosphingobium sp.]